MAEIKHAKLNWQLPFFKFLAGSTMFSTDFYITFYFSSNSHFYSYFGISIMIGIALSIFSQKLISGLIDSINRKYMAIGVQLLLGMFMILMFLFYRGVNLFILLVVSAIISLFYGWLYQIFNSLIKDISNFSNVGTNNGISEISSQASGLFSGFVFVLVSSIINFKYSFLTSGVLCILVSIIMMGYPYENNLSSGKRIKREQVSNFDYVRKNSRLILFVTALNFPYIYVMIGNFIVPIFLIKFLGGNVDDIAIYSSIYAMGAILSGLFTPITLGKFREIPTVGIYSIIFSISSIFTVIFPFLYFFFIFRPFIGIGNGGTRIGRNTITMNRIESENIGKFNGSVHLMVNSIIMIILGLFSVLVNFVPIYYVLITMTLIPIFPLLMANFYGKTILKS